jgi:hypothetical protein
MPCVELFNRTCYPDEILLDALKYAKRKMNVKGDIAVKVTYLGKKSYTGSAWNSFPYFSFLAGKGIKRHSDKKYRVQFDGNHHKTDSATKDGTIGYMEICVERPSRIYCGKAIALRIIGTMLHEMGHVWQFRNKEEILENSTCETWAEFQGYTDQSKKKKIKYDQHPIEKHVNFMVDDARPKSYLDKKRRENIVNNLLQM